MVNTNYLITGKINYKYCKNYRHYFKNEIKSKFKEVCEVTAVSI